MGLHAGRKQDLDSQFSEYDSGEDLESLNKKRLLRKMIEEKLEFKRLKDACKDDLQDIEDEFDWDEFK
jgi:hypothetical protein